MTKPLDPEIKAMRAIDRSVRGLSTEAKDRVSVWFRGRVESDLRRELDRELKEGKQ